MRPVGDGWTALIFALLTFAVFNSNGREVPSYDSQPTKLAARELLLRGTLSLNHVVGQTPQFRERPAFRLANDGHYRSSYSPVPAIAAATLMWPFYATGILDIRAPLAPALISATASSLLVAAAAALLFLTARRELSRGRSIALATAAAIGTGWWAVASRTLWQHETVIFGLCLAILAITREPVAAAKSSPRGWIRVGALAGLGIGLALAARMQLTPLGVVLVAGIFVCRGWRAALLSSVVALALVVPVMMLNVQWFGHALGAAPMLEALHATVHGTTGSFRLDSGGFPGLLFSPNRGILVFSPVLLLLVAGVPRLFRAGWRAPLLWCTIAGVVQYAVYAAYVVWWGGHTYGPRYLLDVLPAFIPLGVASALALRGRLAHAVALLTLTASIGVQALGAFNYPHGRWNNEPADVDTHHERLWDWQDNQIARTWRAGMSPQNFQLWTRDAVRGPRP